MTDLPSIPGAMGLAAGRVSGLALSLARLLRGFVQLTWPATCAACGEPTERPGLCLDCRDQTAPRQGPRCRTCDQALPVEAPAHRCGRCLDRRPAFEQVFGLFDYGGPVGAAIRRAKYRGRPEALAALAPTWLAHLPAALRLDPPEVVVPVPLHWRRLHQRGFSPPLVLADQVARALGVPLRGQALRRLRATAVQAGLDERRRRANLRGAFVARGRALPAEVLLVDDVFTTGATADACAAALRRAGVRRVRVLAPALVERHPHPREDAPEGVVSI